ncbi:MAG: hypothetical protein J0L92_19625 [Deltaproteobacteria bacterium]|nr:hypothetical protein [Deltaproteobacteria bacterium]
MFADLRAELATLPPVSIVAVGGLPITLEDGSHWLLGVPATAESVAEQLKRGLGLGAVLTHRNPKNKSLVELGELCLREGHLWTAHVLSLTVAFARCPLAVRNAFAFDRRFHLSWVEREVRDDPCTFTATASLREWYRVMGYAQEPSFRDEERAWFAKVGTLLAPLLVSKA